MSRLAPISGTEAIMDFIVARLAAMEAETGKRFSQVEKFPGSSSRALLEFMPAMDLPSATVIYSGSGYSNRPLRSVNISVALLVDMYEADDVENLRTHIDAVVKELDQQVSGRAVVFVQGDEAMDLQGNPTLAAALVRLKIEDH